MVWYPATYLWNFIIYTGRETDSGVDNVHSQGTKVVMKLADDLPAVGRCCVRHFPTAPQNCLVLCRTVTLMLLVLVELTGKTHRLFCHMLS